MSRKKIILINPAPLELQAKFIPKNLPLAILSVAANLIDTYDVILIDRAVDKDNSYFVENLKNRSVICVGISCLTGSVILDSIFCSKEVKKYRPDLPVIWGGWHTTKAPASILKKKYIDFIIIGEGEKSFRALTDSIHMNQSTQSIPGVGYKKNDKIIITPSNYIKNLDQIPPLPINLIKNMEPYIFYNWVPEGKRSIGWETSRGCPYKCSFCDIASQFGTSYNYQTPDRMISDIKYLKKNYNISGIRFIDPNFFLKIDRIDLFCEKLISERINLKWAASGTILQFRKITIKRLELFKKAGLKNVEFGIESGHERVRNNILNKKFKNEDCIEVLKKFQKLNIQFKFNIIIGLPGETMKESLYTLDFALNIISKYPNTSIGGHIYMYIPFIGTPLFKKACEMGYRPPKNLEGYANIGYKKARLMPWINLNQRKKLESISLMSYFLSASSEHIPLKGIKKIAFKIIRDIYFFRLKYKILLKTPDIILLEKFFY